MSSSKINSVAAPLQSMVVAIHVEVGDLVQQGQEIAVVEAMKMQHSVLAPHGGRVDKITAQLEDVIEEGQPILLLRQAGEAGVAQTQKEEIDLDAIRPDLAEVQARILKTLDEGRPEMVIKRHARGGRTARENINDLCDPDSFIEYGALTLAAQRKRRNLDDLIDNTPADGIITGFGTVNRALFEDDSSIPTAILSYDYSVLAGTQGAFNHKKTDRVLELAHDWRVPLVFFTEGGGGRPGDTDMGDISVAGLDIKTFATYASMSGSAPRIGVNSGFCFAGNAVIFGCSDITMATKNSWIGMGGPAMIEGGGLGSYAPKEVGPMDIQSKNGVIDLLVEDEADAVRHTKKLLAFFQGRLKDWTMGDQRLLRHVIPEDRKRVYEMRKAIDLIADEDSFLELRRHYGVGMITGFIRVEGHPFGLIANDPMHLGGAIDAPAAEKAGRFMQLCDAFDLPLVSLCDTPGFMVGPEDEKHATVRRASHMMLAGASMDVPVFMICLRKGYGLGAQAMAVGSFAAPFFCVSWPTGEFGGMGLEGAVQLGFKKELDAQETPEAKQELFDHLVAKSYAKGKALSMASMLEIDTVIDPRDSRTWLIKGLKVAASAKAKPKKKRFIAGW